MSEKHVMIIDDDIEEIEIFLEFAKKCQFPVKVHSSTDAVEGISQMKNLGHVDVLFLDVNMPKVSGFDIVKRIKADEQLSRIPIVIMTSGGSTFTAHKAMLSGAFSFMIKSSTHVEYCQQMLKAIESISGEE